VHVFYLLPGKSISYAILLIKAVLPYFMQLTSLFIGGCNAIFQLLQYVGEVKFFKLADYFVTDKSFSIPDDFIDGLACFLNAMATCTGLGIISNPITKCP